MSSKKSPSAATSYWGQTRRPLPCLVFLLPLLGLYELGIFLIGGLNPITVRNGADAWMRTALGELGLQPAYVLPLAIVCVFTIWQLCSRNPWRFDAEVILGMIAESLVLAMVLIVIGRLHDIVFQSLELSGIVASVGAAPATVADLLSYVGAGIYEETLFRLLMLPLIYYGFTLIGARPVLATTAAVALSGLAFSGAHYVGPMAEQFVWFGFIFRWLAGLFFAGVFVLRGFGIVVGAHAAYDILVGVFHFQF